MEFPATNWTQLAQATINGDAQGRRALESLCRDYRAPVVSFLRSRGHPEQDAEDLAQQLFLTLLESRAWKSADRAKGRFRTFLLGILMHLRTAEQRKRFAEKRGSGEAAASLDEMAEQGLEAVAPEAEDCVAFDREWAMRLIEGALESLASAHEESGHGQEWPVLVQFLPGAGLPPSYEEAAAQLGVTVPGLKTTIHRLRQSFRDALRIAVSRTVSGAGEIDDELAYLQRVLSAEPAR